MIGVMVITEGRKGLAAGTYNVTVTDINNCSITTTPDILESPSALSATTVVTSDYNNWEVSCDGSSDGSIDLTFTGDLSVLTYDWSHGAITEDVSGLFAGTYNVTVTDINNCSITTAFDVLESHQPYQLQLLLLVIIIIGKKL